MDDRAYRAYMDKVSSLEARSNEIPREVVARYKEIFTTARAVLDENGWRDRTGMRIKDRIYETVEDVIKSDSVLNNRVERVESYDFGKIMGALRRVSGEIGGIDV